LRQSGEGFGTNWTKDHGRQDDKSRLYTLIRQVHSARLFSEFKFVGDLLVDDTWVGSGINQEIQLLEIAN